MKVLPIRLGLLAVVAFGLTGCSKKPSTPLTGKSSGQNLLLVTLDTTRADHIGCYGYSPAATPTIDGLARRGALFESAYPQAPLTAVSHTTMLTGLYPKEHGIHDNGGVSLDPIHPTLATVFKSHGYKTGAFVASYVLDHRFGLANGFDLYDDDLGKFEMTEMINERQRRGDFVTNGALKWLDQNKSSQFFCWVHYYDPHEPYDPPEPFYSGIANHYDGEISFVDMQLKRITDWLEKQKLTDRTTIIVVGDHGEAFGEHGEKGHAMFVYEINLHVPLVVVGPGIAPGLRIPTLVELADLYPTTLDMFGFTAPKPVKSRNLCPALAGKPMPDMDCYSESQMLFNSHGYAEQRGLTTRDWKYISSTRPELYDRKADPGELHNLIDQNKDMAKQLKTRLLDRFESWEAGKPLEVPQSEENRQALASLGYTGGTGRSSEFLTTGAPDPKDMLPVINELQDANRLIGKEKFSEALPLLEDACKKSPKSTMPLYILGTTYLKLSRPEDALKIFLAGLDIDHKMTALWISAGDALMELGKTQDAVTRYTASLNYDDASPVLYFKRSRAFAKLGQTNRVVADLRKAISLRPDFADALYELGVILADQNQLPEAIRCYRDAAKSRPNDAATHYNLGVALQRMGDIKGAEPELREAIRLKPDYGDAYVNLGVCLGTLGSLAEARAALEKATEIPASASSAHLNLGVTFSKAGDQQNAVAHYEKAVEIDPANAHAIERLTTFYMQNQLIPDAVRILRKGVEASPGNLKFVNALAEILATSSNDQLRDGKSALALIEPACEKTHFQAAPLLGTLAAAYAETGEFDKATEMARKAIDLARAAKQDKLAELFSPQLEAYLKRQPFRNPKY
ncbi:MAG TPA: sulfatase-like hydrolase/transferase [Phycisphaerae bacterium]|nr:sulfatase-like hydrolase/transferase [Phycisphaerae bacterium]